MRQASTGQHSTAAPAWAVWAAYAVPLCILPSAVWRVTLLFRDGFTLADGGWYLLLLSILSMGLGLLTLGLVQRWGERIPGWVPGLGGRTVPVRAATIPALIGGSLLITLCLYLVFNLTFDVVDQGPVLIGPDDTGHPPPGWDVWPYYLPLLAWGPLVLALAANYRRRRHHQPDSAHQQGFGRSARC
ncbi:hypothetical protein [Plantactinospora soyae]|uniref:DUF3995 domain-containing protein n=1 Tax=Plantactinospora soyae TaxID=1544732 RepID=A0A927M058_9ACTN|nr:hypothetical protein [Plantactinospora soyae]MBE1485707.1 hypothetical protein [Plantactinospora soyae]